MTTAQPRTDLDVQPTPLALLLLGREADPASERGVDCPGDLPSPSDPDLVARARAAKEKLGDKVFVLGHHYQRDEVIQFADVTGDSFKLARDAAARPEAEYIVFCGVHFMAESADILTSDEQKVVLPDLAAGCSMADMATAEQVAECWDVLSEAGVADQVVPVAYMNSSADIKAFTGKHGGTICTSSNAKRALEWAFEQGQDPATTKILFLPDQHLGRNTAVRDLGMSMEDCVVYNPHKPNGGLTAEQLRDARMILWRGHCSVHGRFSLESVEDVRARVPGVNVLVHPECKHEVVAAADLVGSTEYIIKALEAAPRGSKWAIGTELNLVRRLANRFAEEDKEIVFLDRTVCFCSTMNRIDLPHLVWTLESLAEGTLVNRIEVDKETEDFAKLALERMLALP
ncbi:quinolinate synthase NadA [Streptomyces albidoflavus]|uniref:quinolinate synthase NadA n=1 Tax=Streptomyces albidoflavus TaxID=1886 RepID=UPI000775C4D4|nr:quinolinate synthase NadA [Streptomyces albidoflavus]SCE25627.1 quinolinate synthetase [Streptomyces sp. IgraMP-1]AMM11433.1 Quinolinate synthase A [Streptomyces albidoflavus]MCX4443341.1 quinolinate synthase NadA [Streptomyces albidoflavus]WTB74921.1 quinolinate synthase NadA [Streptomyces albidoflavus]WTD99358.1 quinolinate synthase NadA [Streptomyces albidoflavus]